MMFKISTILFLSLIYVQSVPVTIYNNAWFNPSSNSYLLANIYSITTLNLYSPNPPDIIKWLFDGDLNDVYGRYNGYLTNTKGQLIDNYTDLWSSPGYAGYGSAVNFGSTVYSIVDHYLYLNTTSFTISAWIWPPSNTDTEDSYSNAATEDSSYFTLFSHCETPDVDKCLHLVMKAGLLYLNFYYDDAVSNTQLNSGQWYHVAFVYDRSTSQQLIYLNGTLDASRIAKSPYIGNAHQIILGAVPPISWYPTNDGLIDELIFVSRVKNSSEILDEATLVAYYTFDNTFNDSGPNNINNINSTSTKFDPNGQFNQALFFASSTYSYFQTTGFYYLGQSSYSYSFSLWIYPTVIGGTILQVSCSNGWCTPMIGFNQKSYLTVQTLGKNGIYTASYTASTLSLNQWTHISMTYSNTNGIRLYVSGNLQGSNNNYNDYAASGTMNTITMGNSAQWDKCTSDDTGIIQSQFQGKIDELKIYSRELSKTEVYQLSGGLLAVKQNAN
ncbi:unnamed protein product [Adineta steineri]|uniref:LamG-like jellyroll fold domain-containing protein n=1 Tax=Adineta steineri TaxID=433720 RepID=A0A815T2B5_9BILA|nr:unnamed protein product [Adineta steineri]CAF4153247.1 unnamed protein product [Adineta steineri]